MEYSSVWIYGAGRVARRVYPRLMDCSIRVKGFLVTGAEGNPERLFDLPVYPIGMVDTIPERSVVLVAMASDMHAGPAELLRQKGFPFFLYYNNTLNGVF